MRVAQISWPSPIQYKSRKRQAPSDQDVFFKNGQPWHIIRLLAKIEELGKMILEYLEQNESVNSRDPGSWLRGINFRHNILEIFELTFDVVKNLST